MNVGEYTYGHKNIKEYFVNPNGRLFIGKYCSIAEGVKVWLGGNHNINYISTYPFGLVHRDKFRYVCPMQPSTKGNVVIGNDVWIGANATIMSGVNIGDGAVIANNSHVVKDVEPYSLVGGNPAKEIRKRFNKEDIEFLLDFKWWDLPVEEVAKISKYLCASDFNVLRDYRNGKESR
jgi:virginiamycin A acetyltransferase